MLTIRRNACLVALTVWSCVANNAQSQPTILGPPEALDLGGLAFSSSISSNGLELYYLDGNLNTGVSTRESTIEGFGEPEFVTGDLHPELSRDGLSLYVNQDPGPFGAADIGMLTRTTLDEPFDQRSKEWLGGPVNTSEWERWPAVSSDGRELYFARSEAYSGPFWEIWVSNRASTAATLGGCDATARQHQSWRQWRRFPGHLRRRPDTFLHVGRSTWGIRC